MFYDRQSSFEGNVFNYFTTSINSAHKNISLCWITDLNTRIDHLAFEFGGQHMWETSLNEIEESIFVTREIYGNVASMKQQCQEVPT
jgi:hypothetical protein